MVNDTHSVFLVEDDPGHASLIRWTLEDLGIRRITTVHTGSEALDTLLSATASDSHDAPFPHRLILLDLNLPDMSGYEVLQRLRTHDQTRSLPVVVLSCANDDESISRSLQAGANAFLSKGAGQSDLATSVHRIADFYLKP